MDWLQRLRETVKNLPAEYESDPALKSLKADPNLLVLHKSFDEGALQYLQVNEITPADNPDARVAQIVDILQTDLNGQLANLKADTRFDNKVEIKRIERLLKLPSAADILAKNKRARPAKEAPAKKAPAKKARQN